MQQSGQGNSGPGPDSMHGFIPTAVGEERGSAAQGCRAPVLPPGSRGRSIGSLWHGHLDRGETPGCLQTHQALSRRKLGSSDKQLKATNDQHGGWMVLDRQKAAVLAFCRTE